MPEPLDDASLARLRELEAKVEALQRFKSWVHSYLDARGVPHHPPGTHGAAGCRVGDRMDWLAARLDAAEAQADALRAALRELRDAAEGLGGPLAGSGPRYARALLEAARLLGEPCPAGPDVRKAEGG